MLVRSMMGSTTTCPCVQHPSFTRSHCETNINECMQGQIQDFLRGGLNIEVISEAGGLGGCAPQKLHQNHARFRTYLSKYKEVLNQMWSRGCDGCNP